MNTGALITSVVACSCAGSLVLAAQAEPGKLEPQSMKKVIRKTVTSNYLLYLPDSYGKDRDKTWPLVLFLHGAGERGDNLEILKLHGPPKLINQQHKFDAIVVAPQCPEDSWWTSEVDTLIGLLDHLESQYKVDKKREYVTGLSMGGYGTWSLAIAQPKRFAAIAPVCGRGNPVFAPLIKHIPTWVFHGEADSVVPFAHSKEMVDALIAAGGTPKFTAYPGVDHDSWTATYDNPEFWKWLLSQKKK